MAPSQTRTPMLENILDEKLENEIIAKENNKKDEALLLSEQLIENNPENIDLYRNAGAVYQNILNDTESKLSLKDSEIHQKDKEIAKQQNINFDFLE